MHSDPKRIVAAGHDQLGPAFSAWNSRRPPDVRSWFLDEVTSRLPRRLASLRRYFKVLLRTAAFVAPPALYALSIRPRMLTWGASPAETNGAYPGDELIRDPTSSATMATTFPRLPGRSGPGSCRWEADVAAGTAGTGWTTTGTRARTGSFQSGRAWHEAITCIGFRMARRTTSR